MKATPVPTTVTTQSYSITTFISLRKGQADIFLSKTAEYSKENPFTGGFSLTISRRINGREIILSRAAQDTRAEYKQDGGRVRYVIPGKEVFISLTIEKLITFLKEEGYEETTQEKARAF